jgi:hypothetical protein
MANPNVSNIASFIAAKAVYGGTLTAAGTGDNTEVTSLGVDRLGFGSAVLVVAGRSSAAVGETLKFTVKISDSDDNSSFSSDTTLATTVTVLAGGASPQSFVYELTLDLAAYKRYVRFKLTPDLSASGTDTAQYGATLVCGGAVSKPV